MAGRLFKILFNSIDSDNRTYVHKIVAHQAILNNSHTILSGLMVRTGTAEPCGTMQDAVAASTNSGSSGYSGAQVTGIVLGSVVVSILVCVALFLAFRRHSSPQPNTQLQESLLMHEND